MMESHDEDGYRLQKSLPYVNQEPCTGVQGKASLVRVSPSFSPQLTNIPCQEI